MVRSNLIAKQISSKHFASFEHTIVNLKLTNNTKLVLVSICRLQFIPTSVFLEEFEELLEGLSVMKESWIIAGDVNFHMETEEHNATLFKDSLMTFSLVQYVNSATHNQGHTLDAVLAPRCSASGGFRRS